MLTEEIRGNATGTLEEASGIYTEEMYGTTLTSILISRAFLEEKQQMNDRIHLIFNEYNNIDHFAFVSYNNYMDYYNYTNWINSKFSIIILMFCQYS